MLRRFCVCALVAGLLGAGTAAPAGAGPADARSLPLVKIGGPNRLKAARTLRFFLTCRADCHVSVTAKLILPGPNLVTTVSGFIDAGRTRPDTLTLNGGATHALKANFRQCRLKVIVRGRNLDTGAHQTARRTFRFKR